MNMCLKTDDQVRRVGFSEHELYDDKVFTYVAAVDPVFSEVREEDGNRLHIPTKLLVLVDP